MTAKQGRKAIVRLAPGIVVAHANRELADRDGKASSNRTAAGIRPCRSAPHARPTQSRSAAAAPGEPGMPT
jgi:hypothetical protein